MSQQFVIDIARETIWNTFLASAPMLGLALIIGLAIGVFQAVTSVNEMTLTFIPKIIIVLVALIIFAPWIMNIVITFTTNVMNQVPLIAH